MGGLRVVTERTLVVNNLVGHRTAKKTGTGIELSNLPSGVLSWQFSKAKKSTSEKRSLIKVNFVTHWRLRCADVVPLECSGFH